MALILGAIATGTAMLTGFFLSRTVNHISNDVTDVKKESLKIGKDGRAVIKDMRKLVRTTHHAVHSISQAIIFCVGSVGVYFMLKSICFLTGSPSSEADKKGVAYDSLPKWFWICLAVVVPLHYYGVQKEVVARLQRMFGRNPDEETSIMDLLLDGKVETIVLFLSQAAPIDFTATDSRGWTLLHSIACKREWINRFLPLVLKRVLGSEHGVSSANPDKIDWAQMDENGHQCISTAAAYGHLYEFWTAVKSHGVRYYTKHPSGKIRITHKVREVDFNRLSEEDKQRFELSEGFLLFPQIARKKTALSADGQ